MPNWVYNGLTIEGSPESVDKLVSQLNQPFTMIHETWDISTNSFIKKNTLYSNPVFAFWNIVKPTDMDAYYGPSPKVDLNKPIRFDSNHWYDWNVRNWGTKWDVAISVTESHPDTYMEGPINNGDNKVVYYNFNTAWSYPEPAIKNLSLQFPDLLFTLGYEEETGWGGEAEFLRGEIISHNQYDYKCKDCEYATSDALEFCEDCSDYPCPQCGWASAVDECPVHSVEYDQKQTQLQEANNV